MKYTADCPQCHEEFEIGGPSAAQNGLQCSFCEHKFFPESIHRTMSPTDFEEAETAAQAAPKESRHDRDLAEEKRIHEEKQKLLKYENLTEDAGNCFGLGLALIVLSAILTLVGFANEMSVAAFAAASGCFSVAVIFLFFSQCLHIRAALEKLHLKD